MGARLPGRAGPVCHLLHTTRCEPLRRVEPGSGDRDGRAGVVRGVAGLL